MVELLFDKGTLLLKGATKGPLSPSSPCFLWDSRVEAYRAPAFRYSQLASHMDKVSPFQDRAVIRQPPPVLLSPPILRPYQEAALSAWRNNENRGIVVLPTGSGKTILAIGAIALLKVPALILVPTRVLLEQWEGVLKTHFKEPIGVLGDGKRLIAPITVSTFESAYRHMPQIGNRFELLIVDEVHHFGNGIKDEALEMCTCPFRLGLTATNVTKESSKAKLQDLIGPTLYELSVTELKGKYLSPFDLLTLQVHLTPSERRTYDTAMKKFREAYLPFIRLNPDSDWIDFVRSAYRSFEGKKAYSSWLEARRIVQFPTRKREMLASLLVQHRNNKCLIFTPDTATAYKISKTHLVMPITADITRKERTEALSKFKENKLKALVSCRVLNEGMDVPDAEVAIIIGGNHGEREHIQRIGRCLRPVEGKRATVYELVAHDTMEVRHWQKRTRTLDTRIVAQV